MPRRCGSCTTRHASATAPFSTGSSRSTIRPRGTGRGRTSASSTRSAIFFHTPEQEREARSLIAELERSGRFRRPIATEIVPAGPFYPAEEYHQQYVRKHGGGGCHI